jgi:membrane protease YdiL (CAAX protease family)
VGGVTVRSRGVVVALGILAGFVAFVGLAGSLSSKVSGSGRAADIVVGLVAAGVCARVFSIGLWLEPQAITVRGLTTTTRLSRAAVLGLAVQPIASRRFRRVAVVCADGRVTPVVWSVARSANSDWLREIASAAAGFGPTQPDVAPALEASGRLLAVEMLPIVGPDPVLSPATVSPIDPADPSARWLGWETIFVVTAFALPGLASALILLAQHIGGVSNLDEFDLPLKHDPAVSLVLLLVLYSTTALVVPIALLLLARTGQRPAALGLERRDWRSDVVGGAGMLAGVFAINAILFLPLAHVLNNKHLTNTATNTHVPAYFIIYALFVSATTAINEEVIVNGYFMTRLAQRGWTPRASLALSLAVRTSYHAYYGVGLIATIPLGYVMTRSFQKRGRLTRPIITHFLNDAILLTAAVLTS